MSLHSDTLSRTNQSLFWLLNATCLAEKLPILYSLVWLETTIYRIQGERANHDTTDAVWERLKDLKKFEYTKRVISCKSKDRQYKCQQEQGHMRGGQDLSPNRSDIFAVFPAIKDSFWRSLMLSNVIYCKEGTYLHQISIIPKPRVQILININFPPLFDWQLHNFRFRPYVSKPHYENSEKDGTPIEMATLEEIQTVIKKLKTGKSPDSSGISAEQDCGKINGGSVKILAVKFFIILRF